MSTHNICFYGELTKIILELSPNTHLIEAILSTHNICFYGELTKIILELSPNTNLICSTEYGEVHMGLRGKTDRKTDKTETETKRHRLTDRQTDRQTDRHRLTTDRHRDRDRKTQADNRQIDKSRLVSYIPCFKGFSHLPLLLTDGPTMAKWLTSHFSVHPYEVFIQTNDLFCPFCLRAEIISSCFEATTLPNVRRFQQ